MTFSCCKERRRRRQPLVSPESQFLPRSRSYDRQAQEPRPCVLRPEQHTSPCRRPRSPGYQSAPTTQSIPTEQNLCWAVEHHGAHAHRQPRALLKGPRAAMETFQTSLGLVDYYRVPHLGVSGFVSLSKVNFVPVVISVKFFLANTTERLAKSHQHLCQRQGECPAPQGR